MVAVTAVADVDPYLDAAERVCALVTSATGQSWPAGLVADMALVVAAVADLDPDRDASYRYRPRSNIRWLRGQTTHRHISPVVRRVVEVYGVAEPVARQLCHIGLGTAQFDDPGRPGSSSALTVSLNGVGDVSDRIAHRWAACLARAKGAGPVPVLVTNRMRRQVRRHRDGRAATGLFVSA
ncbi:hypothetical protein M6B22_11170 [Jatrophihabitans cynanchi]|uniref:DUF222 domain-containing protein n=1 Tax=Jatrophihabitans cynanchi TaxID=2944128 RepID=A0ABY7JRD9_9ACTN|nr:hypothetical protein [Jatrophihabitans sp. SB3-54]WAX55121.1 hypothetical protein M6B22_11170 [Jatrophihabitans sp. SB3-54]